MKNYSKDNEMIARFMGGTLEMGYFDISNIETAVYKNGYLSYHSSWNWLIPVVQKINKLGNKYPLRVSDVMLSYSRINIKELHERVVYFINWYNKQNKNK